MKLEVEVLNINENAVFNHHSAQPENISDSVSSINSSDSVTLSIIDPFLIAKQKESSQNESYLNFYNNHWQNIIKQESQRENYSTVKIITSQEKTISNNKQYYFKGNSDWILVVGMVLVLLLAWIRIYFGKVLIQTFRSTINQQSARKLISEKSSFLQKASSILTAIYLLGSGLFLYELINYYHIEIMNFDSLYQFIICFISVLLFYIFKSLLYWISGVIIKSKSEIIELLSNNNIFYRAAGIILLPIIISIPYVPDNIAGILLFCGISVFCSSFILRVIRGFVLSFKVKLSLFYSFLYFCMLEILPILYILKTIKW